MVEREMVFALEDDARFNRFLVVSLNSKPKSGSFNSSEMVRITSDFISYLVFETVAVSIISW